MNLCNKPLHPAKKKEKKKYFSSLNLVHCMLDCSVAAVDVGMAYTLTERGIIGSKITSSALVCWFHKIDVNLSNL